MIDMVEGGLGFESGVWDGEGGGRGGGGGRKHPKKNSKRGGGGQPPPVAIKLPQAGMSQNSQRLLGSVV